MSAQLGAKIKSAIMANARPALFLQCIALALGLSYFYWPAALPYFNVLAQLKTQYGALYAVLSTSLFGGLLPFLYLYLSKKILFKPLSQLIFYCALWAFMGFVIDQFYQFQSALFGDNNDVSTVLKKVMFDQFVFTLVFASPFLTLCFLFRDSQFNVGQWWNRIDMTIVSEQVPATVVSSWIVWIPAVSVIYTMPSALQIPLFNLVLCFFVLILAILNKQEDGIEQLKT
jgi:hypothetical protein